MKNIYLSYFTLFVLCSCSYSGTEYQIKVIKPQKFSGRVIRKEINFKDVPIIYLNHNNKVQEIVVSYVEDLYKNTDVSDSLYKPSDCLRYYLIKKDKTMVFDTIENGEYVY